MAVGHIAQQGKMSYFCDSSFSGDIPAVVVEPCSGVFCHMGRVFEPYSYVRLRVYTVIQSE